MKMKCAECGLNEFGCVVIDDEAPIEGEVCRYTIRDQRGAPVCIRNLDAPGWCDPYGCPYGGPFP